MTDNRQDSVDHVRIEKEYYVNEPTLELLTRRIETKVKKGVLGWVGFPVGGAGIIAIIIALFVVLPSEVQKFISEDPLIQQTLGSEISNYLKGEEGKEAITINTKEQVAKEINKYFETKEGKDVLSVTFNEYFKGDSGRELADKLVKEYFKSESGQELIIKVLNESLKPIAKDMSKQINEDSSKLISKIQTFDKITSFEKGSPDYLAEILERSETKALRGKNIPIALMMPVRKDKEYNPYAIKSYIYDLLDYFGDNFKYVTLVDENGLFLATLKPNEVKNNPNELCYIITNHYDDIRKSLMKQFGRNSIASISSNWSVKDTLKSDLWEKYENMNIEISVVNCDGKFMGVTSRKKLIDGILN